MVELNKITLSKITVIDSLTYSPIRKKNHDSVSKSS